jgi:hypothetical protein
MTPTLSEEFKKHDDNRNRLAAILADPIFEQAVEALKEEIEALPGDASETNPVLGAAKYQQGIGVNYVLTGLRLLASPTPAKAKGPKPKQMPEKLEDLKD